MYSYIDRTNYNNVKSIKFEKKCKKYKIQRESVIKIKLNYYYYPAILRNLLGILY